MAEVFRLMRKSELEVSEKFYGAIPVTAQGDASFGDEFESMPMAAIVCTTCTRVQFLDLNVIGIT